MFKEIIKYVTILFGKRKMEKATQTFDIEKNDVECQTEKIIYNNFY